MYTPLPFLQYYDSFTIFSTFIICARTNSYIDLSYIYFPTFQLLLKTSFDVFLKIPHSALYLLRFLLSLLFPLVIHPLAYFHGSTFCRRSLLTCRLSLSLSVSILPLVQSNREATPARKRIHSTRTRSNLKLPAI